jgi:hypothetical protein
MSELEKRFHRVMGSMSGNESLATSLDEDAAGELFLWGEAAAKKIVDETDGLDDEAAEVYMAPRLRALRLIMRAVGRWAGEAKSLDGESQLALWNRIDDQARILFGESFALPPMDEAFAELPVDADQRQTIVWLKTYIEDKGSRG